MKWYMEGGVSELAQKTMEEIDASKEMKEDIDSRLKWLGLFHRRKHQCKRQMFSNFNYVSLSLITININSHQCKRQMFSNFNCVNLKSD